MSGTLTELIQWDETAYKISDQELIVETMENAAALNLANRTQYLRAWLLTCPVDTGVANAYAIAFTPLVTHLFGAPVKFRAVHANTGASTVNINELGAVPIKMLDGTDLFAGAIAAGQIVMIAYDGTNYQLLNAKTNLAGYWNNTNCPVSLGANGYQKFNDGLIFQWCTGPSTSTETPFTVSFPIAFPSVCLHAFLATNTPQTDSYGIKHFEVLSFTKNGVSLYCDQYNASGGPWSPQVFAIGY